MEFTPNTEADYTIDGITIHTYFFSYTKNNPTMVLVHGHRSDTLRMLPVINLLEAKYNVIGFDLPGFGKSSVCGEYEIYTDYCADILDKMFGLLNIKPENTAILGVSLGGNIIVNYLIKHPTTTFKKTAFIAPIYSRKYLSMKPRFKKFVFWFTNSLAKGKLTAKLAQSIMNSDLLFDSATKLLDKQSAADPATLAYEKRQWRLMTMQHWGKTLEDLLETDYSNLTISFNLDDVVFVYPKADQYIDAKSSIAGFKSLFPKADFKELNSEMHIPRGDYASNPQIKESMESLINALG